MYPIFFRAVQYLELKPFTSFSSVKRVTDII